MVDSQDFERNTCLTGYDGICHRLRIGWTMLNWLVLIFSEFLDHSLTIFNPRFLCGLIQQGTATERTALRYELCAKMRKASLPSGERWGLVEVKKTYGVSKCIYSIDTWTILFSQDPNRSYLALNKKLQNCWRSPEWKRENVEMWRLT